MKLRSRHFLYSFAPFFCVLHTGYAQETAVLQTLQVMAQSEDHSYLNTLSSEATKSGTDPFQTPQNVQVVNQAMLRDSNAQRIGDVIGLVSGVSLLNPLGGLWDNYSFRGFNTDQTIGAAALRNGVNAYLGLNAAHDLINIERIEFLKGPEAALYGAGDPGGTVNIVTKKPQFHPEYSIELRGGSYDQYRTAIDASNALTDTVAYRIGVAYENNHSFRDEVKNNRLFVAPQLTWQPNDATKLDYDSEYTVINSLFDRGVTAVNQQLGKIPNTRFLGEKDDGLMTMNDYLQQLRLRHQSANNWTSTSTVNYKDNTWRGFSSEAYQLLNAQGDLNRERRYRIYDTTSYLFNHDVQGELETAQAKHRWSIGLSYSDLTIQNHLLRYRKKGSTESLINIYHPQYGINLPAVSSVYNTHERQNNVALSLSDAIEFSPKWTLLLASRFDYYQQRYNEVVAQTSGQQRFTQWSPKAALNYRVDDATSVFVSAGQSFHLNSGLDIQQQPFAPEKAWTYELGMKKSAFDDRLMSSWSIFQIKKQNVLTTNPVDSSYMITAAEESSRGIEWDLTAQPIDALNLKLAYAYIDAKVSKTEAASGIQKGSALLNSPKHNASLMMMYDLWQSGGQKVAVGSNIQYLSKRSGNVYDNGFNLPAYTLVHLNAAYQVTPQLSFQFSLKNLFNQAYYVSSLKDEWVTPGNPREMFVTLNYRFQ